MCGTGEAGLKHALRTLCEHGASALLRVCVLAVSLILNLKSTLVNSEGLRSSAPAALLL